MSDIFYRPSHHAGNYAYDENKRVADSLMKQGPEQKKNVDPPLDSEYKPFKPYGKPGWPGGHRWMIVKLTYGEYMGDVIGRYDELNHALEECKEMNDEAEDGYNWNDSSALCVVEAT